MWQTRAAFFLLLSMIPLGSFGQGDDRSPLSSRFAAEQQFRMIVDENARLNSEIALLTGFAATIDRARQCLDQQKPDEQRLAGAISDLRRIFNELKKANGNVVLSNRTGIWPTLNGAVGNIYQLVTAPLYDCIQPISPQYRQPGQASEPIIDSIREAAATSREESMRDPLADKIPNVARFTRIIQFDDTKKRSDLSKDDIQAVEKELQGLTPELLVQSFRADKDTEKKKVEAVATRLKTELDVREAKIKQNGGRLGALDKSLVDRQAAQSALDRGLVWAIYGMIFALAALFLSLKIFPIELARRIIEERSMVELISMAFMLLTIIILGTGDRIGKETIGALLGTIAGYIFGRKLAEEAKGHSPQAVPIAPPAPGATPIAP
jgi:hypothetical protein